MRKPFHRSTSAWAAAVLLAALTVGVGQASPALADPPAGTLSTLNYAPTSRTLAPVAVHSTTGSVTGPQNVLSQQNTRLSGTGSAIVLDFGKEVGGLATLSFHGTSDANQQVGLA